ncbi:MAG: flagellar biosynthesis protein FlgL [Lachnospiraceae bacterium]|nr:flagellar biosynthesis protein FlgL [Lachnospiraceae bacterium]
MRINHNSLALNASDHFEKINKNIAKSMERLSSGYKITSPADDAAGLAISTKMSAQIRGLDRAAMNSNDGISVIQSAEGGLEEIHSILGRMRELAVQAANDVLNEEDRDAIQEEINNLSDEIDQIVDTTAFNDQKLLNGNLSRRTMSSAMEVQTTFISESVNPGLYDIEVTASATQAMYSVGLTYSTDTVTAEQAGTFTVNGFLVEINEGMTMTEVYGHLQEHLTKIGIDVIATNDGGETQEEFESGAPVIFRTKEYGSDQKIEIGVSNDELAAMLGITDKDVETGTDCQATLTSTDEGFSSTASLTTLGNEIFVVDRNGFEMNLEVEPGAATNGAVTTQIEVFTAGVFVVQTGANSGEQLSIDIPSVSSKRLGVDNLIMYTNEYASEAIDAIDEAVKMVSNIRSKLGAYENRLNDVYDNLEIQEESITAAYSRIMDTNMAEEMTNYTQQDVLSQAAISMMQRSNERPESILQLLQ